MRVVHLVPALFGPEGIVGGAERYALELARHMADQVPTALVTFGDTDRDYAVGALRVRVIGRPFHVLGQRTNPLHPRLFSMLREADVVHCHQQHVVASTAAAIWCRATGRRVFVSDLGGGGWDLSSYLSTDSWFHGHLHISDYSRRVFGHRNEPLAQVILGGVDVQKFSPDHSVRRGERVLFVGRLLPHKGVEDLIQGLPQDMSLLVIGPKPDPVTGERLRRLAGDKNVEFRHGLDDQALVNEYRRAMCVVLPSVYRAFDGTETPIPELLGQTLLEGMACAAPVIASDVASLPEVVEDGVTGFVVPPNNPSVLGERLTWIRDHPEQAAVMGNAGRERVVVHFTWSRVVQRCIEVYGAQPEHSAMAMPLFGTAIAAMLIAGFAGGACTIAAHGLSAFRQLAAESLHGLTDAKLHGPGEGFPRLRTHGIALGRTGAEVAEP